MRRHIEYVALIVILALSLAAAAAGIVYLAQLAINRLEGCS